MASQSLEDGEFWLPPKFLADDDGFVERKGGFGSYKGEPAVGSFEFSNGFGGFSAATSILSSPVESDMGSSETESEEEDYIACLTRQMAHSTLENGFVSDSTTSEFVLRSPQSPLCAVESSCGCNQRSGGGSPNGHSPISLPPTNLDLFFAAAEVARRRMDEEAYMMNRSEGLLVPPRKPSPVSVRMMDLNASVEYYQQLQAAQFQHLRKQQMLKQQSSVFWGNQRKTAEQYQRHLYQSQISPSYRLKSENGGSRNSHPVGLSQSAWTLQETQNQKHHGSGMRAVFLDNLGGNRECAGTGVFLPRRIGNHSVTRNKPACSPVLVPAKVIQALNLNLNDMQVHHQQSLPRLSPRLVTDCDPALRFHSSPVHSNQKRNLRVQPMVNHELRLPKEWTY